MSLTPLRGFTGLAFAVGLGAAAGQQAPSSMEPPLDGTALAVAASPDSQAAVLLGAAMVEQFLAAEANVHAATESTAEETDAPARDIDPEELGDLLKQAVMRDAPDTVLQLLDGVDVDELGFSPLHEAAEHGSLRVARALLDAGFDANLSATVRRLVGNARFKPLHLAARNELPEMAALLIERGADVNASDNGWTPLHFALLRSDGRDRPWRTAKLLVEHGADVHAATAVMGWTPLHFAAHRGGAFIVSSFDEQPPQVEELGHGPDVLEMIQTLIERGADANSRTRIGGWTPLRVAKESDERRRYSRLGIEPSDSSEAVLAALRAAGGKDDGCDDYGLPGGHADDGAPRLPLRAGGHLVGVGGLSERELREGHAAVAPGCEYNLPFTWPRGAGVARREVGSFTAAGAKEALIFESVFVQGYTARGSQVVGLQDRRGAVRPIMAFDSRTAYEGLCLEDVTNTHAAVFTHTYEGRSSPEVDTAYYHYDADAGNLVEAHVNEIVTQPTGEDAVCRWYASAAGLRAYNDALWELHPGGIPYADLGEDPEPLWEGPLPTRVIPAEVVETQLERLRGLPDLVRVWEADLHSPERKIVAAEYRGVPRSRSVMCEGVLLVWDEARQEWRSIYGCARFYEIEIHGDTLSAALTDEMALDCWRHWQTACYLEVDLTTWLAELWEDRFRGHWHGRPGGERP